MTVFLKTRGKGTTTHRSKTSSVLTLSTFDFQTLVENAQEQGETIYQQTALETQFRLPSILGHGGDRLIELRNGLTIQIRHATLWQPLSLKQDHGTLFPLIAKFYLSGSSRVKTLGVEEVKSDYTETSGCNYLYYLPNLTEVEEWQSDEVIQVVMVYAPIEYFRSFHFHGTSLNQPLQELIEGEVTQRFHQPLGQTTSAMNQVLQQILYAPYEGITQKFYLEGKALELLALQFSQLASEKGTQEKSWQLSSYELEQLHAAKEMLTGNISNPPSVAEIAQQLGISEYRLKQGFQKAFGVTPVGHLHHYRMQLAQELLQNSNLSIAGVAARVGYCNPEAFSTAFRRRFGINPKAYQLGRYS